MKHVEWQGFNPFHIYLFTIENLSRLLEASGFRVERGFSYHNAALDRTPEPAALRVRNAVARNLKRLGLLGPAARMYFMLHGLSAGGGAANEALQPHVEGAVERIRSTPPWDGTPDASAALAARRAGDNIVVIATRV